MEKHNSYECLYYVSSQMQRKKNDFKNKNGKHYKNNFILNLVHFIVPVSYLKGNNA